jgi:hypothetical protein
MPVTRLAPALIILSRMSADLPTSRMRTLSRIVPSTAMIAAGFLFGSRTGSSRSREVWMSFSVMPLSFRAASTAAICLPLAAMASRAFLAWLERRLAEWRCLAQR